LGTGKKSKNKPARQRYTAENRREKHKKTRIAKQKRRMAKAKVNREAREKAAADRTEAEKEAEDESDSVSDMGSGKPLLRRHFR